MQERRKRGQLKRRTHQRWVGKWMGRAIATPAFLLMMGWLWLLPAYGLQPDYSRLSPDEEATWVSEDRENLISDLRKIVVVAGSVFLFLRFRAASKDAETAGLRGADLRGADLNCADLSGTDLSSANLSGADLSGANLSGANLSGADLISANLNGADLNRAEFRYTNLSGASLRYANLSGADLRHANLSGADLNCALLNGANLSDANLSGALLFFINSRKVLNLEPLQLAAKPSPFLCNAALPSYSSRPDVDPNRDCHRIPELLSTRYDISLEEAQGIVEEARQHRWD